MISEVRGLAADERGVIVGLVRGGALDAVGRIASPAGGRCGAALGALAGLGPDEARAAVAALVAEVSAVVPAGLARVHPGWLRRALEGERSEVVRAVARDAPDELRRVAGELLAARGEPDGPPLDGPLVPELRRSVLASIAPMPEGDAGPPGARALGALPFAELLAEIDGRGAAAIGLALAGAPDGVVARAAAGAGEPLSRAVLAAARGPATPEARAEARALVAASSPDAPSRAVRAVGLRAVARALAAEGPAALASVAQRLPPAVGDQLLACAEEPR